MPDLGSSSHPAAFFFLGSARASAEGASERAEADDRLSPTARPVGPVRMCRARCAIKLRPKRSGLARSYRTCRDSSDSRISCHATGDSYESRQFIIVLLAADPQFVVLWTPQEQSMEPYDEINWKGRL